MSMFEVIENFYLYNYNNKTRGMRANKYQVGDIVTESVRKRLKDPQRYVKEHKDT